MARYRVGYSEIIDVSVTVEAENEEEAKRIEFAVLPQYCERK